MWPISAIQLAHTRFRFSFRTENVIFNESIIIDIMNIESTPILRIVDKGTQLSSARFFKDISTETIWYNFFLWWATFYNGLPNRLMVDQGT